MEEWPLEIIFSASAGLVMVKIITERSIMELIRIIFKDGASNGNILHGKNKSLRIEWFDNLLLHKLDLINPLRADRTRKAGLNIDNNYCHNAFGQDDQPWCYFESSGTSNPHVHEWGYCDIPTCDQFCDNTGTTTSTASTTTSTMSSTAYMTSTVQWWAILICIIP